MTTREQELEDFKTRIDLRDVAAAQGFTVDPKSTCRNSTAMKHTDGSKIIIGMATDHHMIYFTVGDDRDNGTVIDFLMNRRAINLGEARRRLRPFLPGGVASPLRHDSSEGNGPPPPRLEPVARDLLGVRSRLAAMQGIPLDHAYLVRTRHIPTALLASESLKGRVLVDERNNAIFPHWNMDGMCGYEASNTDFKAFSSGGTKGLFGGRKKDGDTRLAVTESAIDAFSYLALENNERMRVLSTAGAMNPDQPALLSLAIANMPAGSEIIAAVDHDAGGDKLAKQIKEAFEATGRSDIAFKRHSPPTPGTDWNDTLVASVSQPGPSPGPA